MTLPRLADRMGRRLLAAVTAGTALLAVAAPAALAAERQDRSSFVRLAQLAPDISTVDVTLTSFSSSDTMTFEDLDYGEVSEYRPIPPGFYTAALRPADQPDAPALLTASLEVAPDAAATVAVTGVGQAQVATVLTDDLTAPPPGQARVRLLQGASTAPAVDVTAVDGPVIAEQVAFGTATGYADVPAGSWTLRIVPTGGSAEAVTSEVTLAPGSVQTLLILDDAPGVTATPVEDQTPSTASGPGEASEPGVTARMVTDGEGMAQMPSGGVQAGAGSTADLPAPRAVGATLAVLALAGITGLGVAGALLRRPTAARPDLSTGRYGGR
jgi:hypothetical protein